MSKRGPLPKHPPGMICLAVGDSIRSPSFLGCLYALDKPPGTVLGLQSFSNYPAGLERTTENFLAESELEWLWIQNDDQLFAPDILMRLLDRNVDIVAPLVCRRRGGFTLTAAVDQVSNGRPRNMYIREVPDEGIFPVVVTGGPGMLIRRRVFEQLEAPYWRYGYGEGGVSEDVYFCEQARAAGFQVYVDSELALGHAVSAEVWPVKPDKIELRFPDNLVIHLPEPN